MDAGKCLTTDFRKKKKKGLVCTVANFHGVRTLKMQISSCLHGIAGYRTRKKQAK